MTSLNLLKLKDMLTQDVAKFEIEVSLINREIFISPAPDKLQIILNDTINEITDR